MVPLAHWFNNVPDGPSKWEHSLELKDGVSRTEKDICHHENTAKDEIKKSYNSGEKRCVVAGHDDG